jgi:hypothetical protein
MTEKLRTTIVANPFDCFAPLDLLRVLTRCLSESDARKTANESTPNMFMVPNPKL